MNTPFVRLYVKKTGRDLTEFCEDFTFEDSDEKDAYAEFRLNGLGENIDVQGNKSGFLMNSADISVNTPLQFTFGMLGGFVSPTHEITVSDLHFDYSQGRVIAIVKCLDKGNVIKRGATQKIWNNSTASDIAREIASKYDMQTQIDNTSYVYNAIPQSGRSDLEMLQFLAHKENGLHCYVSNNVLHFERVDFGKKATRLFTVGENVVHFSTHEKNSSKNKDSNGAEVAGVNTITGKSFSVQAIIDGVNGKVLAPYTATPNYSESVWSKEVNKSGILDKKLDGKYLNDAGISQLFKQPTLKEIKQAQAKQAKSDQAFVNNFAYNETHNGVSILDPNAPSTKILIDALGCKRVGAINKTEAQHKAESINSKSKKDCVTATLEITLDTDFKIGDIVSIDGFIADRDKGNWYVKEFRHTVSHGKYASTEIKLSRNAVSTGKDKADGELNSSKGKKNAASSRQIVINGNTGEIDFGSAIPDAFNAIVKSSKSFDSNFTNIEDIFSTKKTK